MWKKIHIPEDELWIGFHKQVMSQIYGRCEVKVWQSSSGDYRCVFITTNGSRHSILLKYARDIDSAKTEALEIGKAT